MDNSVKGRLTDALNNIAAFIITGNRNREKAIKNLNDLFQTGFIENQFPELCKAEVSVGAAKNKNALSHPTLKTGLRIMIMNNRDLSKNEIILYGRFLASSERFVRGFMVLGFDTLILQPKVRVSSKSIKELQISFQTLSRENQGKIN